MITSIAYLGNWNTSDPTFELDCGAEAGESVLLQIHTADWRVGTWTMPPGWVNLLSDSNMDAYLDTVWGRVIVPYWFAGVPPVENITLASSVGEAVAVRMNVPSGLRPTNLKALGTTNTAAVGDPIEWPSTIPEGGRAFVTYKRDVLVIG